MNNWRERERTAAGFRERPSITNQYIDQSINLTTKKPKLHPRESMEAKQGRKERKEGRKNRKTELRKQRRVEGRKKKDRMKERRKDER